MPKTIALLVGGWSVEREVSLMKSVEVEAALKSKGYTVKRIEVTRDLQKLISDLTPRPDAVFNNLYGQGGEDGVVQGVLEFLQIPYSHSGVLASAIGMDKPTCKRLAASVGVRVPNGELFTIDDILARDVMPRPYVVKPYNEGSSVGVTIMRDGDNYAPLDRATWTFSPYALVEEYIQGKEIAVAVLDGVAQGVTEIQSATGFFDYEAKYFAKSTEYLLPAPVPPDVYATLMDYAERVYQVLGCSGLARCDLRYDDTRGVDGVYFLEINTQPGFTSASLAPVQVIYNGMSFADLCAHLVETATCKSAPLVQDQKAARLPRARAALG